MPGSINDVLNLQINFWPGRQTWVGSEPRALAVKALRPDTLVTDCNQLCCIVAAHHHHTETNRL